MAVNFGFYMVGRKTISKVLKIIFYQKITNLKKLHTKFCKQTLGVDKQTPNMLAKAELGRYPIMNDIIKQNFRYWQNIISSEEKSPTYKALQANIDMDRKGHISYYTRSKSILAIVKAQNKIYPINKTEIKNEFM